MWFSSSANICHDVTTFEVDGMFGNKKLEYLKSKA